MHDYCWREWNICEDDEKLKGEIIRDLFWEPELINGLMCENLWERDPSPPPPRSTPRRRRRPRPSHPTRRSRRIARERPRRSLRIQMMR